MSALLLLLVITGCGSSKPAPEPQPEPEPQPRPQPQPQPEPAEATQLPPLKTLKGEDVAWDNIRAKAKRTLVVFSTLW